MARPHPDQIDIEAIDNAEAERLLRRALQEADFTLGDEPAATDETRLALLEGMRQLEADWEVASTASPGQLGDVAKQSLRVLAQDPAYRGLLTNQGLTQSAVSHPARDFSLDPITFVSVVTLALVVLSTYVNIERDAKGHWKFQFRINPSSAELKTELLKLVKGLVSMLPGSDNGS